MPTFFAAQDGINPNEAFSSTWFSSLGVGWTPDRRQRSGGHPADDGDQPAQVQPAPDLDRQVSGGALLL